MRPGNVQHAILDLARLRILDEFIERTEGLAILVLHLFAYEIAVCRIPFLPSREWEHGIITRFP